MKILPKITHQWNTLYTGLGYLQGIGFSMEYESFEIYWRGKTRLRIITGIKFKSESEWLRKLKKRMAEDDKQQKYENTSNL